MKTALLTFWLAGALCCSAEDAAFDRLLTPLGAKERAATPVSGYIPPPAAKAAPGANATLNADDITLELEHQLGEHFATDGEVKLSLLRGWSTVKLPAPEWALAITEWPTDGIASTFFLRFKVVSDGQTIADCQMPVKAQLLQEVWMAANRLEKGQALDRSLLAVQKVNIIGEHSGLIPAKLDPSTLEILQPVPAGRPLTRRDVAARPVIRKGQVVEAVAENGRLSLRMKALALESGALGDLIRLRNLESRKDFNGQILNETKVQVHF